MNLIILDTQNKQFDYLIHVSPETENLINNNICKINTKNNTFLIIQTDIDMNEYNKKYTLNQGLYDSLILEYNSKVGENERLEKWLKP